MFLVYVNTHDATTATSAARPIALGVLWALRGGIKVLHRDTTTSTSPQPFAF